MKRFLIFSFVLSLCIFGHLFGRLFHRHCQACDGVTYGASRVVLVDQYDLDYPVPVAEFSSGGRTFFVDSYGVAHFAHFSHPVFHAAFHPFHPHH